MGSLACSSALTGNDKAVVNAVDEITDIEERDEDSIIFSFQENDEGQYNEKEKCFWSSGTCFMIRTELFQKAGGFDVNFFSHMEEIDLCWRLYAMGFEVWAEPNSIVYHKNA